MKFVFEMTFLKYEHHKKKIHNIISFLQHFFSKRTLLMTTVDLNTNELLPFKQVLIFSPASITYARQPETQPRRFSGSLRKFFPFPIQTTHVQASGRYVCSPRVGAFPQSGTL